LLRGHGIASGFAGNDQRKTPGDLGAHRKATS
jgi:hypothetical protein